MATITPAAGSSDYPAYTGYDITSTWDQGSKGSPNDDFWDGWRIAQVESELLKHQQLLGVGAAQLYSPELMGTPNSNPAVISEESNGVAIMTFVDAATTSILLNAQVLSASTNIIIVWYATPTSGNVVWQVGHLERDDDEDMTVALTNTTETDAVSGTANGQVKTTISLTSLTVGETILLKISRLGGDGSDTLAATANMVLVKLETA